jgi:hypothetical protein
MRTNSRTVGVLGPKYHAADFATKVLKFVTVESPWTKAAVQTFQAVN